MTILGHHSLGEGSNTILFLHELMGDCRNYEPIYPYLDKENYTYIFVDHRGYGRSKNILGEYSCEEAANDVINLITHLGLKEIYLTAHSMSTMIAQKVALLDSRVKQLNLITPISAAGIKMKKEAEDTMLEQMHANENKIEEIVEAASKRYNQAWRQSRIDMAYGSSTVKARVGYMRMYLQTNFLQEAQANIKVPIKIMTGVHDFPLFGRLHVQKLFKAYKHIDIIECQEAGHYPMIECPVFFATQIQKWSS